MRATPPFLHHGHPWLGRLGHFCRRAVPAIGLAILLGAGLVLIGATLAARDNLAFESDTYRDKSARLQARCDALARGLEQPPVTTLLARYAPPEPIPAPALVVHAPALPDASQRLRAWRLRGILQQGGQPVAVLNDQIVAVGEQLQGFTIATITESYVDVRDEEGRLHRLDLYDHLPDSLKTIPP